MTELFQQKNDRNVSAKKKQCTTPSPRLLPVLKHREGGRVTCRRSPDCPRFFDPKIVFRSVLTPAVLLFPGPLQRVAAARRSSAGHWFEPRLPAALHRVPGLARKQTVATKVRIDGRRPLAKRRPCCCHDRTGCPFVCLRKYLRSLTYFVLSAVTRMLAIRD